jgi:hypothetical protein
MARSCAQPTGGTTWTRQGSGTINSLNAVYFVDADIGTAVGSAGTILHTTNGGATWEVQSSGTTEYLRGVFFTDANTGTVVGAATFCTPPTAELLGVSSSAVLSALCLAYSLAMPTQEPWWEAAGPSCVQPMAEIAGSRRQVARPTSFSALPSLTLIRASLQGMAARSSARIQVAIQFHRARA